MDKKFDDLNLHQKMEIIIREMVEKELSLKDALVEFEKIFFETASKKYNGNQTKMAKALGLHRNTLHNRARNLKVKKKS
ncbi:MAG: helix-turn-helix domain-containing protein [Candidatus Aminicenantales bacterium]